jgi:hypothetical protein
MSRLRGGSLSGGFVSFVVIAAAMTTCAGEGAPSPTREEACPYRTAAEWQAFLDRWAADARWVRTCEEGDCDGGFYRAVDEDVREVFDRCAGVLARSPDLDACTSNLRRFTPGWMGQHSPDSYGFALDNAAYFAAQEAPGQPRGMMTPPPALVRAVPDAEQVIRTARDNGWKYVVQASCLAGAVLVITIPDPGGRFDQWMMLGLEAYSPGAARVADVRRALSLLTVQKTDAAGNALPRVRLHFRQYALARAESGGYEPALDAKGNSKCYACHTSGVREILPRRTAFLDARPVRGEPGAGDADAPDGFGLVRLGELNAKLRGYGVPDESGLVAARSLGPALGKDVGCTGCHNGQSRGILTVATSASQLDEKILRELAMPPQPELIGLLERGEANGLTAADRKTLRDAEEAHRRLDREVQAKRQVALQDWLLETRCR